MVEEKELYKELGVLTKEKNKWKENIPYVSSFLDHHLHTVAVEWGYYWANRYYLDTLVIVENISLCTFW